MKFAPLCTRSLWPLALSLLTMGACSLDNIDLSGRPCPCAPGWLCETSTNTCVQTIAQTDAPPGTPDAPPATADAACPSRVLINEIVTWARQDWDDSAGGNGVSFDSVPGSGAFDNSTDEWVELYNASSCAIDLRNHAISFVDGTPNTYVFGVTVGAQVLRFSVGGSVTDFRPGEYLVIGNPGDGQSSSQITSDVWIHLDDPTSAIVDEVALGTSTGGDGNSANNAPGGQSTNTTDEAVARVPNATDTGNDSSDWSKQAATISASN